MKIKVFSIAMVVISMTHLSAGANSWDLSGKLLNGTVVYTLPTLKNKIVIPNRFFHGQGETEVIGHLSPDGRNILFAVYIWEKDNIVRDELRSVDIDGSNEKTWFKSSCLGAFHWSPDGKFIILSVMGEEEAVLFINILNQDAWLVKIQNEFICSIDPLWSRDGKSMFCCARSQGDKRNNGLSIVKMDLNGKNPKSILSLPDNGRTAISPDEKTLAFIPFFKNDLYLIDILTGQRTLTKRTSAFEEGLFWSPDSEWVGVEQRTNATMDPSKIYLVNAKTGKWKFLMKEHVSSLSWWQPPQGPLPDCEKIIHEQLGEGRPLKDVLEELKEK